MESKKLNTILLLFIYYIQLLFAILRNTVTFSKK